MNNQNLAVNDGQGSFSFSTRDLIAIGFRQKRAIIITFWSILAGAILATILMPPDYQASTKFLIERSRLDPVVSPGHDSSSMVRAELSEEELNSEVELLHSDDVLRQVVVAAGLNHRKSFFDHLHMDALLSHIGMKATEEEKIAKAATNLDKELQIQLVKKSNLITVTYSSSDPQMAKRVLQALDEAYLQKNLAVHHPPGEFQFFDQEAENYKKSLADAESQLNTFSKQEGGVDPELARDITLQKLSEFAANLQQTYADIASTEKRIDALEKQAGTTPQRLTTQSSASDDAGVLQGMKSTLMSLEIKRTELLTKYQPTYPLVQEIDKEIADTKASISNEENKPLRAETTDRNPTYAWINEELAKAKADDSALQAKAASIQAIVARYQSSAHDLQQKGLQERDLLRNVKTQEQNYLLYENKREEARMTDALDRKRILNVAIAEQPVTPSIPANTRWLVLLAGVLLAIGVPIGMAFVLEFTNPSFRTPSEVLSELNIPVLAAVPHQAFAFAGNGDGSINGNGNGNSNGNGHHATVFANDEATVD